MMTPNKTRFVMTTALGATLILCAAFALSACGKLGHLEQAQPIYGRDAKASWSASQAAPKAAASSSSTSPVAAVSAPVAAPASVAPVLAASAPSVAAKPVVVAQNANGGDTATLSDASAPRETERAKPDKNGKNKMADPYRENKKISDAPLEGFGNAGTFNTNSPTK